MEEHRLSVSRSARYFSIGRPAREVWFVLHGYAQLAARFLRYFEPIDDGSRLIVAPEGLSRFYLTEAATERRVGATWMTKEDRIAEIEDYVRYLDAVYAEAMRRNRAEIKVTVLGFSQGGTTACRWAALGTSQIDRLIVWGGEVPSDIDMQRARRLALVYGNRDEYFTPKVVAATETRLRERKISYELTPFDGGHEINTDILKKLADG
ncbi:MAG TPA: alpha/beta fold hydrolase [Gemmatimonadales bacterium]|jgi:predicted esterase|nr:alpha/beta fold hydrolase [Gemmatimonadales bacterium]